MAAYMMTLVEVTDPAGMEEYRARIGPTIAQHSGRVVAASPPEILEGDLTPHIAVVLEFPTLAAARAWYDGEAYREPTAIRHRSTRAVAAFIDGIPGQ